MEQSGRPETSGLDGNVAKVKNLLDPNRRLSVRLIAEDLYMCKTTMHKNISEIMGAKVPKVLSDERNKQVDVFHEMLEQVESEPDFLSNVITGDKTCVFQYNPETKFYSSEWHTSNSPCPRKRECRSPSC